MAEIEHLTIDGRPASVAFMDSFDGDLVPRAQAACAIVRFEDDKEPATLYMTLDESGDDEGTEKK